MSDTPNHVIIAHNQVIIYRLRDNGIYEIKILNFDRFPLQPDSNRDKEIYSSKKDF